VSRFFPDSAAFRAGFAEGRADMRGVAAGIAAWGLVTGVAMVNSGMPLPVALAIGLLVFAGSAQLAAIPLIVAQAPLWLIVATACCVNLRFVIFSAQMRPYFAWLPRRQRLFVSYLLGDLSCVLFLKRFHAPGEDAAARERQFGYFAGGSTLNWTSWIVPQTAGMLLAAWVPSSWGLGFAGVMALLGVTLSLLADRLAVLTAAAAAVVAVLFVALPLKLNLLLAIAVGMGLALGWQALVDRRGAAAPPAAAAAGDKPRAADCCGAE
jgi:predicted branched-subunit amino acid permease